MQILSPFQVKQVDKTTFRFIPFGPLTWNRSEKEEWLEKFGREI